MSLLIIADILMPDNTPHIKTSQMMPCQKPTKISLMQELKELVEDETGTSLQLYPQN